MAVFLVDSSTLCPTSWRPWRAEPLTYPRQPRVTAPPLRCLPAALFTLNIFFWPVQMCMFSVWSLVCVAHSSLSLSVCLSVCLFGFTQPKPWQQCWLRGLCIPLGWWRGLSSVHSLRPGADRSFTSTSLSNTPLDMRQHPAKRTAGDTRSHWQTLNTPHKHTEPEQGKKTGRFCC